MSLKDDKEEIKVKIIDILGKSAFNNSCEVPKDVSKLSNVVNYLVTQLDMISMDVPMGVGEYIEGVVNNAKKMI